MAFLVVESAECGALICRLPKQALIEPNVNFFSSAPSNFTVMSNASISHFYLVNGLNTGFIVKLSNSWHA